MDREQTQLTPEERCTALAAILATGLTRWHEQQRRLAATGTLQNSPDSSPERLELSPDTVLCVTCPVNGPEIPRQGAHA